MKIRNLLMSALMMAACTQAFAQDEKEVLVFPVDGTPANGMVIQGTNISFTLGADGKWKALGYIPAGAATADFKQPYVDSNGDNKEGVVYITGDNNPKDGPLSDANASTGSGYKPSTKNVPQSGTYYMITPTKAGKVRAVIVLNANKSFYVTKSDGTMLDPANGELKLLQPSGDEIAFDSEVLKFDYNSDKDSGNNDYSIGTKLNGGIAEFQAEAGETYYIFCTGSKLGFAGVEFTPGDESGPEPGDVRGDLDGDGHVTVTDIMILVNIFIGAMQ